MPKVTVRIDIDGLPVPEIPLACIDEKEARAVAVSLANLVLVFIAMRIRTEEVPRASVCERCANITFNGRYCPMCEEKMVEISHLAAEYRDEYNVKKGRE